MHKTGESRRVGKDRKIRQLGNNTKLGNELGNISRGKASGISVKMSAILLAPQSYSPCQRIISPKETVPFVAS